MFHSYSLIINGILIGICIISYNSIYITCLIKNLSSQFNISAFLLLLSFSVLFFFLSFMFVFICSLIHDVQVGKPPVGTLVIAYKYGLSDAVNSSSIFSSYKMFPTNDKVHICYERRHGPFGIAHGAVIQDDIHQVNEDSKAQLIQQGYKIFQTTIISNAMYISCPTVPWFSLFGIWMVLRIIYPKIYKYSKKHRLSAYPVVELYRRFSVMLMVPLSQQDNFVVPEAKPLLHRSSTSTNISLSSVMSVSTSAHNSKSVSFSRDIFRDSDNNIIKPNSVHTSTPKLANVNTKQG